MPPYSWRPPPIPATATAPAPVQQAQAPAPTPAHAPAPAARAKRTVSEKAADLRNIKELLDMGAISQEEFEVLRAEIMNS